MLRSFFSCKGVLRLCFFLFHLMLLVLSCLPQSFDQASAATGSSQAIQGRGPLEADAEPDIRVEPTSLVFDNEFRAAGSEGNSSAAFVRGTLEISERSIEFPFALSDDVAVRKGSRGDRPFLRGFHIGGRPGDPELPYACLRFLLPQDVDHSSVKVSIQDGQWEQVAGEYDIAPVLPAVTSIRGKSVLAWGDKSPAHIIHGRDITIYERDEFYPSAPVTDITLSKYRQWNLAVISVCPVTYNPVQKVLWELRSGILLITFERKPSALSQPPIFPGRERFWKRLAPDLENPENQSEFYPSGETHSSTENATPNYIIITTSSIQSGSSNLNSFVAFKQSNGYRTAVITEGLQEDDSHFLSGVDAISRAENIRNWLQARYLSWAIDCVLLIGDPNPSSYVAARSIPMMMCYNWDSSSGGRFWECPTDMYYAELSGDWDKDGDGYSGEYNGDFGNGGIDRYCEIGVGRIPFYGSFVSLDGIVEKLIRYENESGDTAWRKKLLAAAAISNFGPQDNNGDGDADDPGEFSSSQRTFGADWGEAMAALANSGGCIAYTLYEKTGCYDDGLAYPLMSCDNSLSSTNVLTEWRNHYGFVTWWAHGSETSASRLSWMNDEAAPNPGDKMCQNGNGESRWETFWNSQQCAQLSNEFPSYIVQVSCDNGYPENSNNLGYSLLRDGAVGTFSATRVSWYSLGDWRPSTGSSCGDNASYAYYIFREMVKSESNAAGALNQCKSDFGMDWAWQSWMNCLDFNLYGDPSGTIIPQRLEHSFTVYNEGDATLSVSSIAQSPAVSGLFVEPTQFEVSAGGSQIVTAYVDFEQAPKGQTETLLLISSNDPDENPYPDGVNVTIISSVEDTETSGGSGGGGSCFIATAAYGSPAADDVAVFRAFRDRYLVTNACGRKFVDLYYKFSPPLARYVASHQTVRKSVRLTLVPVAWGCRTLLGPSAHFLKIIFLGFLGSLFFCWFYIRKARAVII